MNRAELHRLVAGLIPCDASTASIVARRVVDAVLPQITTEEEWAKAPGTSWLLGSFEGSPSVWKSRSVPPSMRRHYLEVYGPLTVVWQPS